MRNFINYTSLDVIWVIKDELIEACMGKRRIYTGFRRETEGLTCR